MTKTLIFGGMLASAAFAAKPCPTSLAQGHSLNVGESICSDNGEYRATMQADGNFVVVRQHPLRGEPPHAVLAIPSRTATRLELDNECNLALLDANGTRLFQSSTAKEVSYCEMSLLNDGTPFLHELIEPQYRQWQDQFLSRAFWQAPANLRLFTPRVFVGYLIEGGGRCELSINEKRFSLAGYTYYVESSWLGGYEGESYPLTISSSVKYAGHHTYTGWGNWKYSDLLWHNLDVEGRVTLDANGIATGYDFEYFRDNHPTSKVTTLHCRGLKFQ